MQKTILSTIIIVYLTFMVGCAGRNSRQTAQNSTPESTRTEEACGHDHEGDEGHDHEGDEGHEGHDHENHEGHEGHDHENHEGHEGHDHENHEGHEGHDHGSESEDFSDEIIFPEAQAKLIGLEVERAALGSLREVIKTSGDITAAQGDAKTMVAPIAGIVSLPQTRIVTGMKVNRGDVMFYVSSKSIAGGDAAAKAKSAYESAKSAYERAETLLPDRIVSQREYDDARRDYLDARNAWEALSSGSTDKGSAVRAPISGYVSTLAVGEGEFVEVGQQLAVVSQNIHQQLIARVPQRHYSRLSAVKSANIVAPNGELVVLAERNGRFISVANSLEQGSLLIPVILEFDAHPAIIAGSSVETYLLGAERENILAVPIGALTESQGIYFVYQQIDSEGYLKHEVKVGASDGQRVEIISGIKPGMRIVTRGAVHVKMATSSAIPHSHQH